MQDCSNSTAYALGLLQSCMNPSIYIYLSHKEITCGSNPMSNMRSASSSTMYVIRRRLVTRPGEHTA